MSEPPVRRIGRYEVVEILGQGGMGRVLLARDTVLGRLVAIKVTRDDLALAPEARLVLFERMRNEARAAAALSHPNMVTIHDMGEEPSVGLYLVFEYVDGPTLRDRLHDGALPPQEVAKIARQLGDALATAHAAGVLHRDVKPENVLLAKTGAKLADFGIARLPDSTLTRAGVVLGTPAYSAPEALATGQHGPESDQFSLAATLYEAIGGVRAFPGDDALHVAARVANEEPPPLDPNPQFDARGANAVLTRALSKDPKKRFASSHELGDALGAALERRPTLPPPPPDAPVSVTRSSISIEPRSTQRKQNIAAGAAAIVIVVLLLMGNRRAAEGEGASLKAVSASFASAISARGPRAHPPSDVHGAPRSSAAHAASAGTVSVPPDAETTSREMDAQAPAPDAAAAAMP
jgi:serine/threonine-protein kinase